MFKQRVVNVLSSLMIAAMPAVADSQTVAASTFGPGDSYSSTSVGVFWYHAAEAGFVFESTTDASLNQIRLALLSASYQLPNGLPSGDGTYSIGFWRGGYNSKTLLEAWSSGGGLVTLLSVVRPVLTPGDSYWITAASANCCANTGWFQSNFGGGYGIENSPYEPWTFYNTAPTLAFDVTVADPPSSAIVTPEPSTYALMATGLFGLGVATRRRRQSSNA
jgi:hypothetical protein